MKKLNFLRIHVYYIMSTDKYNRYKNENFATQLGATICYTTLEEPFQLTTFDFLDWKSCRLTIYQYLLMLRYTF